MASESKKRLALAIIDFLNTSSKDGTIPSDESESIEVATQIIADSFGVDPSDKSAVADALGGQSLLSIYGVFEKMKGKNKAPASASPAAKTPPTSAPTPTPPAAAAAGATDAQKAEAEQLKAQGNSAMAKKEYASAIDLYTKALAITPGNPIFLSNRAAAYSASQQHEKAALDAQAAVDADPKYSKAWSRLGLAKFALGDTRGSMLAYEKGIEAEGGKSASEAMRRGYETAKRRLAEEEADDDDMNSLDRGAPGGGDNPFGGGGMPDFSALAGMFGGGGGGGGPDLAGLMSNPMIAQMAQNLMKNPDMIGKMMNNPKVKEMMDGVGGGSGAGGSGGRGGGLPDLGSLMSDPSIAEMAKNLMGGSGAGAPGAPR
ncbi:glutamine-rich cytoplasmic protein [Peziza echinospora]|nr:glutamine-rich cytoplasmic protein [Peziza echinospora]